MRLNQTNNNCKVYNNNEQRKGRILGYLLKESQTIENEGEQIMAVYECWVHFPRNQYPENTFALVKADEEGNMWTENV